MLNKAFSKDLRCLAVQNFLSSGTSLFASLMDYHPNIISIPFLYMVHFYDFYDEFKNLPANERLHKYMELNPHWFEPSKVRSTYNLDQLVKTRMKYWLSIKLFF